MASLRDLSSTTQRHERYSSQRTAGTRPSSDVRENQRMSTASRAPSRHERNISYPERGCTPDDPYDLTEVAAPPPVREGSFVGNQPHSHVHRRHLEDEERNDDAIVSSEGTGPYRPRTPAEYMAQEAAVGHTSKWLTELYTVSYLIFFAIWGTLARIGIQWLTFFPGTPIVTPVIWANFAGSVMMGFLAEDQRLFRAPPSSITTDREVSSGKKPLHLSDLQPAEDKASHTKRKKTIPLYIGLATGFCGSFTSFSAFARDAFLALSNDLPTPINHPTANPSAALIQSTVSRNRGYSFQAWLHVVLATIALSLGGLVTGAQLAGFLAHVTPRIHGPFVQKILNPATVLLGAGCWLGAILLSIFPPHESWRGEVLFAIVFAPLGCLLRFYLSLKLNPLVPPFPLGTFTVNMLGTAIQGMCFDIQHVGVGVAGRVGGGTISCQVLQGVMDGFCGCLTTVSTWVVEINGLKRRHGWVYTGASVLAGLGLMVVVMGSVRWNVGWRDPACGTGYVEKVGG